MKRLPAGILCIILVLLFATSALAAGTQTAKVVNCTSAVNVRSGPGTGYGVIGFAPKGASYPVLQINAGAGYHKVNFNGKIGYISARYLSISSSASTSSSAGVPIGSSDARYQYLLGMDTVYFSVSNPPKGYKSASAARKNMTTITVKCWRIKSSGIKYASSMKLTVSKKLAENVKQIFDEIYALPCKFPIKTLVGYHYGKVTGPMLENVKLLSHHSFGAAIDINYMQNDYYLGKGNDLRDRSNPYYIPKEVIAVFTKYGWYWGGNFPICADTMHFQYLGLDFLQYPSNPFTVYDVASPLTKAVKIRHIQRRLKALHFYSGAVNGVYGGETKTAVQNFQRKYGLTATGTTTQETYIKLYNLTNNMVD